MVYRFAIRGLQVAVKRAVRYVNGTLISYWTGPERGRKVRFDWQASKRLPLRKGLMAAAVNFNAFPSLRKPMQRRGFWEFGQVCSVEDSGSTAVLVTVVASPLISPPKLR